MWCDSRFPSPCPSPLARPPTARAVKLSEQEQGWSHDSSLGDIACEGAPAASQIADSAELGSSRTTKIILGSSFIPGEGEGTSPLPFFTPPLLWGRNHPTTHPPGMPSLHAACPIYGLWLWALGYGYGLPGAESKLAC
eukprot:scaffold85387_cov32-Tisochrysis_lutea.AAC.2